MYYLQSRAVVEIQPISNWSHLLQHLKRSHIPVLELPWKLQLKVTCAQQNLLPYSILHTPVILVFLVLLSLLGMEQALMHQLLDLPHIDLINTSSTALDPVRHIHRHPNRSSTYYIC